MLAPIGQAAAGASLVKPLRDARIHQVTKTKKYTAIAVFSWWRCRESNPGPN
jgi:hypothetical protein